MKRLIFLSIPFIVGFTINSATINSFRSTEEVVSQSYLLLETGDFLLLETGDKLILE